jgi:hypothetical protein
MFFGHGENVVSMQRVEIATKVQYIALFWMVAP